MSVGKVWSADRLGLGEGFEKNDTEKKSDRRTAFFT